MTALTTPRPGETGNTARPAADRDGFLDTVRAISILRVVLWHTFGFAAITYVVSAVPAMFFVTGSLLARSIDRKGIDATYRDRLRRLLVPFWAFGAVAVGIMIAADRVLNDAGTKLPWSRMLWWVLPLEDPPGSAWQAGWLNDPLWYVRAMLWVILLAPALVALARRARAESLLGAAVVVVVADLAGRDPSWLPADLVRLPWLVGDLALYGGFAMLGVAHRDGALDGISRRRWATYAALSALAAAGWILTQPVEGWVVNNSQPAHLLVGLTWLCLAFVVRAALAGVPDRPTLGPIVRLVNQRSLTIYLWHAATIIIAYQFLSRVTDRLPTGMFSAVVLALVACMTTAAVLAFGWIEDVAGRRHPRLWPAPRSLANRAYTARNAPAVGPALVFGVAGIAVLAATGIVVTSSTPALATTAGTAATGSGAATAAPRVSLPAPSRQPERATFERTATTAARYDGPRSAVFRSSSTPVVTSAATTAPTATTSPAAARSATSSPAPTTAGPTTAAPTTAATLDRPAVQAIAPAASGAVAGSLQAELERWAAENGIGGASVAIARPGVVQWSGVTGVRPDGARVTMADRFPVQSITKTFTSSLIMREVARGSIRLDDPLPRLTAVPEFPYAGAVTIRQLLDHSSGLVNYRVAPAYLADPASVTNPASALRTVGREPLGFPPGTKHQYSSSNSLALGMLLEQLTGRSFEDLVGGLFKEFGLDATTNDSPEPSEPRGGTSGVRTNLDDLLRWGVALLRDHAVFPDGYWAEYATVDPESTVGAVWGYCPCTIDPDGNRAFGAIGHSGGTTLLNFSEVDDVVVVVDVPSGLWNPEDRHSVAAMFAQRLRTLLAGGAVAP